MKGIAFSLTLAYLSKESIITIPLVSVDQWPIWHLKSYLSRDIPEQSIGIF